MSLIFKGEDNAFNNIWKWALAGSIAAISIVPFACPVEYFFLV